MERKPIDQLSEELDRLGEPESTHQTKYFTLLIKYAIATLALLVGGVNLADVLHPRHGKDNGAAVLSIASLVALAFALVSARFCWTTTCQWFLEILVCPGALVQVHRKHYVVIRWEEIALLWQECSDLYTHGLKLASIRKLRIQLATGERLVFDSDLTAIAALGRAIENAVVRWPLGLIRLIRYNVSVYSDHLSAEMLSRLDPKTDDLICGSSSQ